MDGAPKPPWRRGRWVLAGLVALALAAGVALVARDDGPPSFGIGALDPETPDPFAYLPSRAADLTSRAAAGNSHILYAKSPRGAEATAARVSTLRPLVDRAARRADVDADLLEALVFLESAGRPEVVAGRDLESAAGLTQILAGTGRGLLGMRVDTRAARRLLRRLRRARARGDARAERRLLRRLRRADERFDPRKALAATGRYLTLARERLGRPDLALVSYHMGIGNLQRALGFYGASDTIPYVQLYFDSTPTRHARAWRLLARLGDDSSTYLWRVLAARDIMRLYRTNLGELRRRARLQTAKSSGEELLHPRETTQVYDDADELESAYDDGELRPFPDAPAALGLARDPRMGGLARRLDRPRRLYRGLRPEAYALAVYMAAIAREQSGISAPLTVTSTVRDREYQGLLTRRNPEATRAYSLHTTGWAFDVARRYRGRRQAVAFQFALDRLQALNLIAWVREPGAIHITAAEDSRRLLPLLGKG